MALMPVSESQLAQVVAEISAGAAQKDHVATVVGELIRKQPIIGHYVQSHVRELTIEGTVLVLLHAAVVARSVELARGRRLPSINAAELDQAARGGDAELAAEEPELWSYLEGNVPADDPTLGGARRPQALALLRVVTRALTSR
jgi:hypothetical protein